MVHVKQENDLKKGEVYYGGAFAANGVLVFKIFVYIFYGLYSACQHFLSSFLVGSADDVCLIQKMGGVTEYSSSEKEGFDMNAKPARSVSVLASLSLLLGLLGLGVLVPIVIDLVNLFWAVPACFLLGVAAAAIGQIARKRLKGIEEATWLRIATIGGIVGVLDVIVGGSFAIFFFVGVCIFGVGC